LSAARHTGGPWDYWPVIHGQEGVAFVIYPEHTSEPLAEVLDRDQAEDIARLMAAAPELLSELQKAHQIILNALAVMTTEQKLEWARANDRDGCIGEGTTRFHERAAAIAKATGSAA